MKHKKKEFLKSLLNRLSYDEDGDAEVQYEPPDPTTKLFEAVTNYTMTPGTADDSTSPPYMYKYEIVEFNASTPNYDISDYTNQLEVSTIIRDVYTAVPSIEYNVNWTNATTIEDRIIAETMSTNKVALPSHVHVEEMTFNNNSIGSTLIDKRRFKWWRVHERILDYKHRMQTMKLQWWAFFLMFLIVMCVLFLMSFLVKKFNEYRLQEQLSALEHKSKTYTVQVQNTLTNESEVHKKCIGNHPVILGKNDKTGISFVFTKDDNKKADGILERTLTTDAVTSKAVTDVTPQVNPPKSIITRKFNADPGNILDPLNIEKTTVIKYGAVEINYNVRRQETKFQNMPHVIQTDDDLESSTESEESHAHTEKHLVPKKEHHALNVPGSTDAGPHNTHPPPRHDKTEEHVENEVSNVRFVEYTHIQNKIHGNMNKLVIRDDSDNTVHFNDLPIAETPADIDKPSSSTTTKTADTIKQAQSLKSLLSERCDSSVSHHMHNENRILDDHFKTFMGNIEEAGNNAKIQVKEYIDKIELVDSNLEPEKAPERMDLDSVKNKQNSQFKPEDRNPSVPEEQAVVTEGPDASRTEQSVKIEKLSSEDNHEK